MAPAEGAFLNIPRFDPHRLPPPPPLPTVNRHGADRNKPCACGSGKKAKKCCLLKMELQLRSIIKDRRELREAQAAKMLHDGVMGGLAILEQLAKKENQSAEGGAVERGMRAGDGSSTSSGDSPAGV
jgi:hypothetical protein